MSDFIDEQGQRWEQIEARLELGINPVTGKMMVKMIDAWKLKEKPENPLERPL